MLMLGGEEACVELFAGETGEGRGYRLRRVPLRLGGWHQPEGGGGLYGLTASEAEQAVCSADFGFGVFAHGPTVPQDFPESSAFVSFSLGVANLLRTQP